MTKKHNSSSAHELNFSALGDDISISGSWVYLKIIGMIGFLITVWEYFTAFKHNPIIYIPGVLFFGMAATAMVIDSAKTAAAQAAQWQQFLTDNNWELVPGESIDEVPTSLLSVGHEQKILHIFSGRYAHRSFTGLVYKYKTGFGNDEKAYTITSFHFKLNQQFPYLELHQGALLSMFPDPVRGTKYLHLEGNFNEHFSVSVQPGAETKVLEFLTPDFMSEIQPTAGFNLELAADDLFLFVYGEPEWQNMTALMTGADVVFKQLADIADSWQASSTPTEIKNMAEQALLPRVASLQMTQDNPF